MKKLNFLIFSLCLLFSASVVITSCKNSDNTKIEGNKSKANVLENVSGIPSEVMDELWNKCSLVDYIFHDLPFSMNQSNVESIRTNLNYISKESISSIPSNCKPIARQFFQVDGDIKYEADVYFSDGCQFYVFVVNNNQPKYANKMTSSGVDFFNNIINQALNQKKALEAQQ